MRYIPSMYNHTSNYSNFISWALCIVFFASFCLCAQEVSEETTVVRNEQEAINLKPKHPDVAFQAEQQSRTKLAQAIIDGVIPLAYFQIPATANEQKIHAALQSPYPIHAESQPLTELTNDISQHFEIPVLVNSTELDRQGVVPEAPVDIAVTGLTLRQVLQIILEPFELTYTVRNGVLEITTQTAVESNPPTEVYRLPQRFTKNTSSLMNVIQQSIEPDSWQANGGTSSMIPLDELLIISAPTETHYKVQELLGKMIERYESDRKK